ncbi:hypothetical protein AM682 [Anaplasma marginale str. St. Maries]|uniref:Uncharacterized protein n=1 Tax=Anaplasma marginale (strain Florida) TaxID=320483 RepID=B9KIQ3_ANAMF|nr:hypothetical protein AM682 [Anaplasma marginale str. St. Maries]ACM49365.1 Hypothetical protein AMF_1044 [Anaplasma marginale str. Florida]
MVSAIAALKHPLSVAHRVVDPSHSSHACMPREECDALKLLPYPFRTLRTLMARNTTPHHAGKRELNSA